MQLGVFVRLGLFRFAPHAPMGGFESQPAPNCLQDGLKYNRFLTFKGWEG